MESKLKSGPLIFTRNWIQNCVAGFELKSDMYPNPRTEIRFDFKNYMVPF